MIKFLEYWDWQISLFINSFHCELSDQFWLLITARSTWYLLYGIIILFLYLNLGWKKATIVVIFLLIGVGLCDFMTNIVKHSVCRLRPCCTEYMVQHGLHILVPFRNYELGFFSAHASNSFFIAQASYLGFRLDRTRNYKPYKIIIFLWAAIVSISRIFVAKHFFGDILVGAMFGIAWGYCIAYITRIFCRLPILVSLKKRYYNK